MQTYHCIQDKICSQKKNLKVFSLSFTDKNFLRKKSPCSEKTVWKFFTCIKSLFVITSTVLLLILGTLYL